MSFHEWAEAAAEAGFTPRSLHPPRAALAITREQRPLPSEASCRDSVIEIGVQFWEQLELLIFSVEKLNSLEERADFAILETGHNKKRMYGKTVVRCSHKV
ncbi:methionyl-tRNA formyltransferase [Striga asiatica]|uniref:Methionyl-tRNA formyltransferase n=1 Tax=Striga asiatica TaxID=4170 RepID=A0A5A7RIK3_STRAF|nr:methionyl-tRNA formyltransferase [Striga asiatica]